MLKKLLLSLLTLGLVAVIGFNLAIWQFEQQLNKSLNIEDEELITISSGTSLSRFSKELVNKGWIDTRFWLRNYARLYPQKFNLKVGTYKVNQHDTLIGLVNRIVEGKEHQLNVTFIEGSTVKEWLEIIKALPSLVITETSSSPEALAKFLKLDKSNPEGWLFPDTYSYTVGTKDTELYQRAYRKMKKELDELWEARQGNLPYSNSYEALIMASIIEKETGVIDEQPIISSVFVNRLYKKMRLQTDPTIIYGLGERYQGDITRAHKYEKTAYNTYRINGLPPTPIAMPGYSAIKAALNPTNDEYYYFVSKGNGSHYFSTTLKEHNAAVRKYQLGIK